MALTDLEICKRIAEIEGIEFFSAKSTNQLGNMQWIYSYKPLTDDALLNQLILEHEVSINFHFCTLNMVTNKFYEMNFTDIPSLKRNVLLLIIEAHKENV